MTLKKHTSIIVVPDGERLARTGADLFLKTALESIRATGRFTVAVSGGSTPRAMHRLLAKPPLVETIPWERVYLFWVDERMVPPENEASNYGTALKDFLHETPLPRSNVFSMVSDKAPAEAASDYQERMRSFFGGDGFPSLDLIMLGIGTDGHTASIFPGDPTAVDTDAWVAAVRGGNPLVDRLTLTLQVLNRSKKAVFLVSGRNKSDVARRLIVGDASNLPAGLIRPAGDLIWLLDAEGAALLPESDLNR